MAWIPNVLNAFDWVEPVLPPFQVMIDIETLDTKPGGVILNVGAIEFCPITGRFGKEFFMAINPADSQVFGMTVDTKTVSWWMQQSAEAREASFGKHITHYALWNVLNGIRALTEGKKVWSHGSMDIVMLEWAFRQLSYAIPWDFRDVRCTRTVYDLAGVKINRGVGTHHNALDDARAQAVAVIEGYRKLCLKHDCGGTAPPVYSPLAA